MRRDLPGGWVELRDPATLTERQARTLRSASRKAMEAGAKLAAEGFDEANPATWGGIDEGNDGTTPFEAYQDALVVAYVDAWSWTEPTSAAADVLPQGTYAALIEACYDLNNQTEPDFGPSGAADPLAATANSNGSASPSSAEPANP